MMLKKLDVSFAAVKVHGSGSMKPSILKTYFSLHHPTHAYDNHTSLQAKGARFRAVGLLLKTR